MSNVDTPFTIVMAVLVILFVFLVCREIVCWYWKLNRIVALLESIDLTLKEHRSVP